MGIRADDRPVLVLAVVVRRDGAATDVRARADVRVTEVREVLRLRALADDRLLRLDEVADLGAVLEHRARAKVAERADLAPAPDDDVALDHGAGQDARAGPMRALRATNVVAASRTSTPAAINSSRMRKRIRSPAAASCDSVLTPRTSSSVPHATACTRSPRRARMRGTSVR